MDVSHIYIHVYMRIGRWIVRQIGCGGGADDAGIHICTVISIG